MEKKTIQLPDAGCTGCGACLNICPKNAISMTESSDGHLYPQIDEEKCIACSKCMRSCHALKAPEKREPLVCYAATLKDAAVLKKSTSGGMFYALAKDTLSQGGVVYACVYDKNYRAYIERLTSLESLSAVYGSKYVWSSASESYEKVRDDLANDKKVLYTALPCQVSGLLKFLGRDDENLFAVDVLCGGAPSPYAFDRYLETLTDEKGRGELHFQFRDKDPNGCGVNCTYTVDGKKHLENYVQNSFYFSFCSKSRVTWRRSCYTCDYKSIRRVSDMTIGDYWGAEKYHPSFDRKAGISVVMVNTNKGKALFERVKDSLVCEKSDVVNVMPKNSLVKTESEGHHPMPDYRDAFFSTLRNEGWNAADQKYLMTQERKDLLKPKKTFLKKLKRVFGK